MVGLCLLEGRLDFLNNALFLIERLMLPAEAPRCVLRYSPSRG